MSRRFEDWTDSLTPPLIVEASEDGRWALRAFIAQELEHWGFFIGDPDDPYSLVVRAGAREFLLTVEELP